MTSRSSVSPVLRPAEAADAAAVAEVYLRSFTAAMPGVQRAHPDDEVRTWVREVLVPAGGVEVAEVDGKVVGFIALSDGCVDQLYVDPSDQGRGIGARLLGLAKSRQPNGLQLWTFQVNRQAQRFYERHGFGEVERTDGSGNEEREPDVRYAWPGAANAQR